VYQLRHRRAGTAPEAAGPAPGGDTPTKTED
jgi:hypothetical protein